MPCAQKIHVRSAMHDVKDKEREPSLGDCEVPVHQRGIDILKKAPGEVKTKTY
jgi:hypothetical protein